MSRDDGFPVADVDSGYFEDAKMRDLWQRLRDADRTARATCLHAATLLASWRHGERVTVWQAVPMWLPVDDDLVAALRAVKLLDRSGRIPAPSFDQWFGAASARREAAREKGRLGGLAKAARRSSPATAQAEPSSSRTPSPALPVRPSVRTDSESPQPPTRGGRRADATNPRSVSAEIARRAGAEESERRDRREFRRRAYFDGRITEAQRSEMDACDAPLDLIPAEHGAAYAASAVAS